MIFIMIMDANIKRAHLLSVLGVFLGSKKNLEIQRKNPKVRKKTS